MNDKIVLDNLLLEKNLTKQQLADILGVKLQSISQISTGARKASKSIKERIRSIYPDIVFPEVQTQTFDWFIEQRKSRNLTQQEFADMLGISQSLCTKIENGERTINKSILEKIKTLDEQALPEVAYINYCPNLSIPNQHIFSSNEKFAIDKRLIQIGNLNINPDECYLLRIDQNDLQPMFNDGDMIIITTSIKHFLNGHIHMFSYNNQTYIRKIVLLPNKIKCISLSCKEDTFYLEDSTKGIVIYGMIIPKVRL